MLKNDRGVLPLPAGTRVALIGPLADAPGEMRGPWWGAAGTDGHVSVLAGLRGALSESQVLHAAGVDIDSAEFGGHRRARSSSARRRM